MIFVMYLCFPTVTLCIGNRGRILCCDSTDSNFNSFWWTDSQWISRLPCNNKLSQKSLLYQIEWSAWVSGRHSFIHRRESWGVGGVTTSRFLDGGLEEVLSYPVMQPFQAHDPLGTFLFVSRTTTKISPHNIFYFPPNILIALFFAYFHFYTVKPCVSCSHLNPL